MTPARFTKVKIAVGFSLLLILLLFSLLFIRWEMDTLSVSDDRQGLMTDSLLVLLRQKDHNTIQMLRVLGEANDGLLSTGEIEQIIVSQDTVPARQRVQHRVITKRDSLITRPQKKGFFKRLGEVFSPSKRDSAVLVNTSLEFATDTVLDAYSPKDSLNQKIREAVQQKRSRQNATLQRKNGSFSRLNTHLSARMDSLVKEYEQDRIETDRQIVGKQQDIRQRSTRTIGGIAIGAVLLAAFFLILIWRDITRSNRYRRQLEEANCRSEELLEAREKLMLAITHDFKAPLGSILGYVDLLARLTADERQLFYLHNMKSSSRHLLKLVSDLLDFHRLDLNKAEVNRVTFNPTQLFEEIRDSFEPLTAGKGLVLNYRIDPVLDGHFISDPLRIRQIVDNLLSNAVKFTSQGSITLALYYTASRLRIDVTDTGQGMASANRQRIFQEFTRLPGAQGEEGFGLGLSIVRKLVTLLEGNIHVQSSLGVGSTFTVVLPLFAVNGSVTLPVANLAERILLIDDDRIQLTLTAAMLEQQGIRATCCEQPDELIEQLRTHTFDALLTDVQMPAINGFDLLKLLRASNISQAKTIPVIAVTARSEPDEAAFLEHGFAGCLYKPFTMTELIERLGRSHGAMKADSSTVDSSILNPSVTDPLATGFLATKSSAADSLAVNSDSLAVDPQSVGSFTPDFRALTAFSVDDPEAARSIITTFIEETTKNISRMEAALAADNPDGVADMGHKLLPLFTLIGATEAVRLLTPLECCRGSMKLSSEIREKTLEVLPLLKQVVEYAEKYLAAS